MARFYEITLTPNFPIGPPTTFATWSSFSNGVNDPGALNVEFDFYSFQSAGNQGLSTITIHGIALADISQAQQYAGMLITVKAGFVTGLPLANPAQAGVILQGTIFQSWGNWVGTERNLNFLVNYSAYTYAQPGQFQLNCPAGTSLIAALTQTLNVAYPTLPIVNQSAGQYVFPQFVGGYYRTLTQLAKFVQSITTPIAAPGLQIAILPNQTILLSDTIGPPPQNPKAIAFNDLIGQPTWVDVNQMQFWTQMRGDIQVGNYVTMPPGLPNAPGIVSTAGQSLPSSTKYVTSFQGQFVIQAVRQVGNFRDAAGASWASVFTAAPKSLGAT
jgi:hypothetical protein